MVWFNKILEAVLIGFLLGLGFVVPAMWWMSFVGVGYFLYLLQSDRMSPGLAWTAWTIKYLLALWWFWTVYPLDWLPVDLGGYAVAGIGFYWLTAGLWLGSGSVFFVYLYRTVRNYSKFYAQIALPFMWLMGELLGAWVFSIVTFGPGASLGSQFSFGFVGYHLAQHGLLVQTAVIAGVYGLTVLLVAMFVVAQVLYTKKKWTVLVGVFLLLATSQLSFYSPVEPDEFVTVAVVDTTVAPAYWQTVDGQKLKSQQITEAYEAAQKTNADYVVLPEDSRLLDQSAGTSSLLTLLSFTHSSASPALIDSGRVDVGESSVLQGVIYNSKKQTLDTVHKQYLVPQGEFMPTLYYWLLRLVGLREAADTLQKNFSYVAGTQSEQNHLGKEMPVILFCFESVDPRGIKKIITTNHEAPFVAHVVSHGWFNDPVTLWPQLEAMLRIQAIWNDVYVVSSANHALGYTITPDGEVRLPDIVEVGETWKLGLINIPVR